MERKVEIKLGSGQQKSGCGDARLGMKKRKVFGIEGLELGVAWNFHLTLCHIKY
jgi:hypothetical protein